MSEEPLLSINEASHLLGVSEGSLRQWTDEGKIKAFITPGGHRRYSKTGLKKFTSSHQRILGVKDLITGLEETAQQHREIARISLQQLAWYDRLNGESQEHLADLGKRMLKLIIKYVSEPSHREDTIQTIREVGHDHGQMLAMLDVPLTSSVEVFLMHRDPITGAATSLMKKREAYTGSIIKAIPLVTHAMDEALVALVEAHQQYRNGT